MKRYAIVRVELGLYQKCPANYENIDSNLVCEGRNRIPDKIPNCRQCYYGDTKEQLVAKVAQVIREQIKKNYIDVNIGKIGYFIRVEELAKEIVEFLGVEE